MKSSYSLISLVLVFFLFVFSPSIRANDIQIGGQLNASVTGFYDSEMGYGLFPEANLDLELFLPSWNNYEIKCAGYFFTDIARGKVDFFWKRLYWKHRFENLHLTIGRQPVSWSFGSLLNPVDYSLGAVALDRDYSSKYQDAMEAYFPINWNTSLSLVASLTNNSRDLKVGVRGRTLINGFDVTVNFVQEQLNMGEGGQRRFGITTKGDLGPFGVYGAMGYYREKKNSFSILAGFDYSYFVQAGNRLYFQIEYLNIPPDILPQIAGFMITEEQEEKEKNMNLVVSNASYQIDEFSSISLTSFCNFSSGLKLIMPSYSNQINTNTTAKLQAGITLETEQKLNSSSLNWVFGKPSQFFVELGIDYSF
jgi:hypothetical protein